MYLTPGSLFYRARDRGFTTLLGFKITECTVHRMYIFYFYFLHFFIAVLSSLKIFYLD